VNLVSCAPDPTSSLYCAVRRGPTNLKRLDPTSSLYLLCILDDIPRVAAGICSVVCVIENSNGTYCILLYVKVKKTWKVQKSFLELNLADNLY
jgi:hypothetical protein